MYYLSQLNDLLGNYVLYTDNYLADENKCWKFVKTRCYLRRSNKRRLKKQIMCANKIKRMLSIYFVLLFGNFKLP